MGTIIIHLILVCFNGNWVKNGKHNSYKAGESQIILGKNSESYVDVMERLYNFIKIDKNRGCITIKYLYKEMNHPPPIYIVCNESLFIFLTFHSISLHNMPPHPIMYITINLLVMSSMPVVPIKDALDCTHMHMD